jgi:hypothetical protein
MNSNITHTAVYHNTQLYNIIGSVVVGSGTVVVVVISVDDRQLRVGSAEAHNVGVGAHQHPQQDFNQQPHNMPVEKKENVNCLADESPTNKNHIFFVTKRCICISFLYHGLRKHYFLHKLPNKPCIYVKIRGRFNKQTNKTHTHN